MKVWILFTSLLLASCLQAETAEKAETLDYSVEDGKFITSEGAIPNGCFAQLVTELNGDNSVAAIFINRNASRGCIAANFPHPGGNEDAIDYEISKDMGDHKYNLTVCEKLTEGTMKKNCDQISVQFVNRVYTKPDESLTVLVLEKTGEW